MGGGARKRLGRRWRETWKSDVRKAVRMAYGRLEWRAPDVIWDPTLGQLDGALERLTRAECVGVDIETGPGPDGASGLDPERALLRCVGLGGMVDGRAFGVCPGMVSIEAPPRELLAAPGAVRERVRNFLARGAAGGGVVLCGNNVNVFDRRVLDREGMPLPGYLEVWDATLLHSVTDESELPHSLDYQMSRYTDSPKHKPGGRGGGHEAWKRDVDLRTYCAYDAIGSAVLTPRFVERVNACGMGQVYEAGVTLQRLCLNLRRAGIRIDPAEQARHGERLRRAMGQAQERAERAAVGGCPKLGSPQQIAHYLFERRGMQPTEHETEAGDPSTKEDALYEVLARRSLCVEDREFVEALLGYRRAQKKLGTFVTGLKPEVDGRVRCSWSAHSTVVGRVSCSDPINCQTIPDTRRELDSLRSMFVAAPGNVLVGADADQIHLRIIAARTGDRAWLDAFARGQDVHVVNAAIYFGKAAESVTKAERVVLKTLAYLYAYAGGAKKALAQLVKLFDPVSARRPYASWTLGDAKRARDKFLAGHPALERWWDEVLALWRAGQVPASFVLGRKRYFLDLTRGAADDESRSELVNHSILATERDLLCTAIQRAMESIGWAWDGDSRGRGMGGPGLILDLHDGLYAEVAEARAEEAKAALLAAITQTFSWGGREVPVTASAKVGRRWSDL